MKRKRLLKFYFSVERINRALDNLITENALRSADHTRGGEYYAEKICSIICAKRELSLLWKYLDGIIEQFDEQEKTVLRYYGLCKKGGTALSENSRREVKRVLIKFARRSQNIFRFEEGIRLVNEYYCLM